MKQSNKKTNQINFFS